MRAMFVFLGLLICSGCAFQDRGNLSDAMESSSSGGGGSSHHHGGQDDNDSDSSDFASDLVGSIFSEVINGIFQSNDSEPAPRSDSGSTSQGGDEVWLQMPLDVSYLVPLNGDIEPITRFGLTISGEGQRNHLGLYMGGGAVQFTPDSLPDQAVDDAYILEVGLGYRRYFNDPHVFISPYIAANLGWQPLFWEYRNSIDDGDHTIDNDVLNGATGYAGVGVALWRRHWISAFGEAGFGGTAYLTTTGEGFHNDVFDDFGYFCVKVGVTANF